MADSVSSPPGSPRFGWLPAPGTWKFHLLLSAVAIFVLGPLGGIAASYMNFSLGFFVGGQVLAGILGSAVTYGYGPDGKHGANFMQTMAASVASMCAMGVLIQAMVWLGMPQPPVWHLMLFVGCVGMFGVGVGMLYTPLLVDRLQLDYPSGYAVANILRALTDKRLLKASIAKLGSGTALGALVAGLTEASRTLASLGVGASTVGAGMVVGSRVTVPAVLGGLVGAALTPFLREWGWLGPEEPFRKVGFLGGLGMICGAAVVDLALLAGQAVDRVRNRAKVPVGEVPAWKQVSLPKLFAWIAFWGVALVLVATQLLDQPLGFVLFGMTLALLFVLINGIAYGITDQNPISSAFVVSVLLMSLLGLKNPLVGMMSASILLICTSVGCDMQQDRSTGWRLGTDRTLQFRYQVVGIVMGAVLCVGLARVFMSAYPVLAINQLDTPGASVGQWNSAMTYKLVGAIRSLGALSDHTMKALIVGLVLGFVLEVARKLLKRSERYVQYVKGSPKGQAVGWVLDSVVLASPYASSFGAFVNLSSAIWFGVGGIGASLWNARMRRSAPHASGSPGEGGEALPEDMSTTSLLGGGLIAGESLFFLIVGIAGLVTLLG
ncbi:OPT/YSL family transporter [Stigmatella aurantiaca]|uniref:Oligopeptide transporter n=1 Tax=Stigmatella aurantiaca (strain DW4/3-1) TaxID=378806 RepID=Q08US2_STIAD|nr:OPT/YSL family transporter [Stigmatella aurantiaca]ADO71030.1 oligopeptide transporter [Stigmatella aurantiaca DW4/3-1]EAU64241.1 oligopeptide transporter OPT superfamily [Stigmatella aurantiaca DW4/3-1]